MMEKTKCRFIICYLLVIAIVINIENFQGKQFNNTVACTISIYRVKTRNVTKWCHWITKCLASM